MFYGDVFRALNRARVKYVVAGGTAVILHGYKRLTEDLDLIKIKQKVGRPVDLNDVAQLKEIARIRRRNKQ